MRTTGGQRSSLAALCVLLICGFCCCELGAAHSADQEHQSDNGFKVSDSAENKPPIDGRPTLLNSKKYGYFGTGCCDSNMTTSPNAYWRIVCPSANYDVFVVLMGVHVAPESFLQIKTTQFEGSTNRYHSTHFHKRSVLAGFISNSTLLSAFKVAYVCVATDKQLLAMETLESRAVLDYFASNDYSLDLFLRFLNDPVIIFSHGAELQKIQQLINQDPITDDEDTSANGNPTSDNMTGDDLES